MAAISYPRDHKGEQPQTSTPTSRTRSWTFRAMPYLRTLAGFAAVFVLLRTSTTWLQDGIHRSTTVTTQPEAPTPWAEGVNWEDIKPSSTLIWQHCYSSTLDCARLSVPLDWQDPSDPRRVVLAVVRLNATDRTSYLGPLFVNPGGPGGSSVEMVVQGGAAIQVLMGENHDIVGIDPRGIGATTPQAHCWGGAQEEQIYGLTSEGAGLVDAYPGAIYDIYARQSLFNVNCGKNMGAITRFAGTTSVARDMLAVLEEIGGEKAGLRYWGMSYGTVLGGTFAAMFPDRVERVVNDGNVNLAEWYNSTGIHFSETTDKGLLGFFYYCHKAGPSKCAFYESSPHAIQKRLETLYERLRMYPVQVLPMAENSALLRPQLVTYSDVKSRVITSLYRPLQVWPALASALQQLENGEGYPFLQLIHREKSVTFPCGDSPSSSNLKSSSSGVCLPYLLQAEGNADGSNLVKCAEGPDDFLEDGLEALLEYEQKLKTVAPLSGSVMFGYRAACAGWGIRGKWRFNGPWENVTTSHPVLFIGNTYDNITPLSSAIHNSGWFRNSSVLVQNSYGHCSTSTPSVCTASIRKKYFQTGEVPANGTVCEADVAPWDDVKVVEGMVLGDWTGQEEDQGRMEWALGQLGQWEMGKGLLGSR